MEDKQKRDLDQLDFRLILAFTNAYGNLYRKGLLTEEQLDQVSFLLDNYQNYSAAELESKLKEIFPDTLKQDA
ncbi:MAG: hypothetical protein WBK86_02240 [Halanaerobiales bacterium]